MLTQERLKEILSYDPKTGIFINITQRAQCIKKGSAAGWNDNEYIRIEIDNKPYRAHRLAWLYMTGGFPESQIDHINRIKHDNRFCNLRSVSNKENSLNKILQSNSTTGYIGVSFVKRLKVYRAYITIDGKQKSLGYYNDIHDAVKSRHEANLKYGFNIMENK